MDPGPASVREETSSGQELQDHSRHEVFLSHSGKQKPFVWDLFNEFRRETRFQVIEPFFDQQPASLPKGEDFPDRIFQAAENCDVAVVILSEDYLTSKWPMLELITFVDALKTTKPDMRLIPIFYDGFLPSDIKDAGRWIAEWEKMFGYGRLSGAIHSLIRFGSRLAAPFYSWLTGPPSSPSCAAGSSLPVVRRRISLTVDSCKEALQILRKRTGHEAGNYTSLSLLQKAIVNDARTALPALSSFHLETETIQGRDRLCEMISGMFREREGVQCLGLYGMGGSGKTTMCTALCSHFEQDFDSKVYSLDIGCNDIGKQKVIERHEELLRKLLGLTDEQIGRIRVPTTGLQWHLKNKRVFLAVDNVQDDPDSLQEARDYLKYLRPGSRIIFTARSRDIVLGVLADPTYCKPIPNLEEAEAMSLFLRIAAPERLPASLNEDEICVLRRCLQICYFLLTEGVGFEVDTENPSGDTRREKEGDPGHFHPLALRAVASYFKNIYSKNKRILDWIPELFKKEDMLYHCGSSKTIFDVLGIGFHKISREALQIFIDVALYAPPPPHKAKEVSNWLVAIHAPLDPNLIEIQLQNLRTLAFLDYKVISSEHGTPCWNIIIHDLYREYAKRHVNKHENDDSYTYGVYYDQFQTPPVLASTGWAKVPRIHLKSWKGVMKLTDWCHVSVIHLVDCETITAFSLGVDLVNVRCLTILGCSKLEVLSWTEDMTKQLSFVDISFNNNLKILPDFINCPQLRTVDISECSSSVEPLNMRDCPNLKRLFMGRGAPEIPNLQSCSKLKKVRLVWKASRRGQLDNLSALSNLVIEGRSSIPLLGEDTFYEVSHPVPAYNLFCKQYPAETLCYELSGVWKQRNLRSLHLNYIPLGCLPLGLRSIASSLEDLNLEGCLLSQLIDFRAFPNLRYLSIKRTNVKRISGVRSLEKLVSLDCRFCFRLQKIPDLRSLRMLEYVFLAQNPDLQAIPRLPQGCFKKGTEDSMRESLAVDAFASCARSALPPPLFTILDLIFAPTNQLEERIEDQAKLHIESLYSRGKVRIHFGITCDGCNIAPIVGPRYRPKTILMEYDLCSKCYSNKCRTSDCRFTKSSGPRIKRVIKRSWDYDLCYVCFRKSGCDESEFWAFDQTMR